MKTDKKEQSKKKLLGSNSEPVIDPDNYNMSLSSALNHYNENYEYRDYKNSAIDYAMSIGIDVPRSIPEVEFRSIGAVCRLLLREQPISIKHIEYVNQVLTELAKSTKKEVVEELPKEVEKKPKQNNSSPIIEYLSDKIDDFILNRDKEFSGFAEKYSTYQLTRADNNSILEYIKKQVEYFQKIYDDYDTSSDVKEAYADNKKTDFKKIIAKLNEISLTIGKIKSASKPKVQKDKPATVQVAKMEYMQGYYNTFEGIHPKNVIGKSMVLIFDTATRDLILLQSISGKFKASGTSFTNLDESKCHKKKIRKPDETLRAMLMGIEQSKKAYRDYFDSIKTTEQKGVGRMSSTKIILGVF